MPKAPKKPIKKGRPTKYDPTLDEVCFVACQSGTTDKQLCRLIGAAVSTPPISENTLNLWKRTHPTFKAQYELGRSDYAGKIGERMLMKKTKGYKIKEITREPVSFVDPDNPRERVVVRGEMIVTKEVTKHIIPSDKAIELTLRANKPEKYRNDSNVRISGPGGGPIETHQMTHDELLAAAQMRVKLRNGETVSEPGKQPGA